jgi:hypothetical protein
MRLSFVVAAVILNISLFPSSCFAQSLKEKKLFQGEEEALAKELSGIKTTCGSDISASFDWDGAKAEDLSKNSASGYCSAAISALEKVCSDDTGKEAVKSSVKSVVCKIGAKREATLKDGVLSYVIQWDSANDKDFVYDYLMNNL